MKRISELLPGQQFKFEGNHHVFTLIKFENTLSFYPKALFAVIGNDWSEEPSYRPLTGYNGEQLEDDVLVQPITILLF